MEAAGEQPEWCGQCNKRTRELMTPAGPKRCACHPLGRKPLPQFSACPDCHSTVYKWDRSDCRHHIPIRGAA